MSPRISDFTNRVGKNARHLAKWARRSGIQCYRVYDRDIPEFAFALDLYSGRAHLQEYQRRAAAPDDPAREHWREEVRGAAAEALGLAIERVTLKQRTRRHAGELGTGLRLAGDAPERIAVDVVDEREPCLVTDRAGPPRRHPVMAGREAQVGVGVTGLVTRHPAERDIGQPRAALQRVVDDGPGSHANEGTRTGLVQAVKRTDRRGTAGGLW